ncbi:hypothetical protein GIB67_016865 [Kingdonia uniflora]|uniref:Uncharacterized protein n=1 Tax=Kingdonia uniflora TaxID=39325 RepID=A0A7J7LQ56_9MAGN|nr:hypothetical protein GIB67_016865 [Kingdonia uniflora]
MGFSSVVLVGHDDGAWEFENPKHVPLCVEGWDETLHEIGRLSSTTTKGLRNEGSSPSLLHKNEGSCRRFTRRRWLAIFFNSTTGHRFSRPIRLRKPIANWRQQ